MHLTERGRWYGSESELPGGGEDQKTQRGNVTAAIEVRVEPGRDVLGQLSQLARQPRKPFPMLDGLFEQQRAEPPMVEKGVAPDQSQTLGVNMTGAEEFAQELMPSHELCTDSGI